MVLVDACGQVAVGCGLWLPAHCPEAAPWSRRSQLHVIRLNLVSLVAGQAAPSAIDSNKDYQFTEAADTEDPELAAAIAASLSDVAQTSATSQPDVMAASPLPCDPGPEPARGPGVAHKPQLSQGNRYNKGFCVCC